MEDGNRRAWIRGLLIAAAMLLAALFAPVALGDRRTDPPTNLDHRPADTETLLGFCFRFDGVTNNGDGTSTWTYTVYPCGAGRCMHRWVLELASYHTVVSSNPQGHVGYAPGIGVYGIYWNVDIRPDDPPQTFTFTLSEQYAVTAVRVAARVPPDDAIGSLDGPCCLDMPPPTPTPSPTPTPTPTNAPPSVNAVGIYQPDRVTPATAMDPQAEYAVRVSVSDPDGLASVQWVRAVVFLDADGDDDPGDVPTVGDLDQRADALVEHQRRLADHLGAGNRQLFAT